jgi:hypothetical protein
VLKRAVNARLHALRSNKRGQFGGLLHKMKVSATGAGVGIAEDSVAVRQRCSKSVITGRRSEPLDFGLMMTLMMTLFDYMHRGDHYSEGDKTFLQPV